MRIPRIYTKEANINSQHITLDPESSHYLAHVLRLKERHPVILFNGIDPIDFHGKIININKKQTVIEIIKTEAVNNMPPVNIHLFQAISKGDRFEEAIQKATELGITSITPLITNRVDVKLSSERMAKKHTHWHKILISASEQSKRAIIPKLNQAIPLNDILFLDKRDQIGFILSPYSNQTIKDYQNKKPQDISLIIGPEGGLNDEEVTFCQNKGFDPIKLGNRILRTETAPIAMISLIEYLWGDF